MDSLMVYARKNRIKMILCRALGILMAAQTAAQEPNVVLTQGIAVGVKAFPDTSRLAVYAYLGVPYAAPPVGDLRFAPPQRHPGWNKTLFAQEMGPLCPQLPDPNIPISEFEPGGGRYKHDEDCLYLNVWTPETAIRYGNLPVVVIFDGEDFARGSPVRLPAQDLASEGVVVVSATYRNNIFGFFCLGDSLARGNLGLLDQYFALLWVRENIVAFGGDAQSIVLMGHSSGAASVMYHMASPRTNGLFSRAILMSGTALSPWLRQPLSDVTADTSAPSRALAKSLGCSFVNSKDTLRCMRRKSKEELLKAYGEQYQNGNWSQLVLPVVDSFLVEQERYLPLSPEEALHTGEFQQIPVLIGITSVEASSTNELWNELASNGDDPLLEYIVSSIIPGVIRRYGIHKANSKQMHELIVWQYLTSRGGSLLSRLQTLLSDAQYLAPHVMTLKALSASLQPMYAYIYQQEHGLDLYARVGNQSGAGHGTELPLLFGPTLLQQLARRRMTKTEERLSKHLRVLWADFIKLGNPTPGRQYEPWRIYSVQDPFVMGISAEGSSGKKTEGAHRGAEFWNVLIPRIDNLTTSYRDDRDRDVPGDRMRYGGNIAALRHGVFSLLGLVIILLALLAVSLAMLKKTKDKARDREIF